MVCSVLCVCVCVCTLRVYCACCGRVPNIDISSPSSSGTRHAVDPLLLRPRINPIRKFGRGSCRISEFGGGHEEPPHPSHHGELPRRDDARVPGAALVGVVLYCVSVNRFILPHEPDPRDDLQPLQDGGGQGPSAKG